MAEQLLSSLRIIDALRTHRLLAPAVLESAPATAHWPSMLVSPLSSPGSRSRTRSNPGSQRPCDSRAACVSWVGCTGCSPAAWAMGARDRPRIARPANARVVLEEHISLICRLASGCTTCPHCYCHSNMHSQCLGLEAGRSLKKWPSLIVCTHCFGWQQLPQT